MFQKNYIQLSFQKYMPKYYFYPEYTEIKKFFKNHKKIVIKPIHSFGGNDIHFFEININLKFIKIFKKHGHIMCQNLFLK